MKDLWTLDPKAATLKSYTDTTGFRVQGLGFRGLGVEGGVWHERSREALPGESCAALGTTFFAIVIGCQAVLLCP